MDKFIDILFEKVVGNIIKLIGIVMAITILLQIFSRSFMKVPFSWTEELSRITFMWFCFLGSGVAMKKKAHLGIDYFVNKWGKKSRFVNEIVINVIIGLFSSVLLVYGIKMVQIMHKQVSAVMRIPMSYFYAVIPLTGGLFLILSIYFLINLFKKENSIKVTG